MKKIYSMLLLIVMLCSLSIVSASENLSTSDNPVVVDNVDMSSKNIGSIPDVTSASNDVVVSENSSVEWKSYENEKDDNVDGFVAVCGNRGGGQGDGCDGAAAIPVERARGYHRDTPGIGG